MEQLSPAALADGLDAYVYAIDYSSYELLYVNVTSARMFPSVQQGCRCFEVFFGRDTPCECCPMRQMQGTGSSAREIRWVDALKRWLQMKHTDITLNDGTHLSVLTALDVTAAEDSLYSTEQVLDGIHAAAYVIDPESYHLSYVNEELKRMLPTVHTGDLCHKALWDSDFPCPFCPMKKPDNAPGTATIELYNKKLGRYLSINMAMVKGAAAKSVAVFTGYDITRLVESERGLKQSVFTDGLTGVRNRPAFMAELSELFTHEAHGCVCVLNVRGMKRFNLLFGKAEGDKLLRLVTSVCARYFGKEKVYRVDGAKLAFLTEDGAQSGWLRRRVEAMEAELQGCWSNPNFQLMLDTVYVCFPRFAQSPEQVIFNAEYLLRKDRGGVVSIAKEFTQADQDLLNRRNRLEDILRIGPATDKFSVYYQPIYNIAAGRYDKCEALLRLNDEVLGWVSPVEFIPLAETEGYIRQLGHFVLEEVCCLLREREDRGLPLPDVSVNVSPIELLNADFCKEVIAVVRHWGVSPSHIQLEITESVFINSRDAVLSAMRRLIDEGFTFAIDDFGTGYSNLSYMGSMPFKFLKLDKSFVDQLDDSGNYQLIVSYVIKLAKELHLNIVAEGIETEHQYELLKRLGSDFIQGFLFSKPLPREAFESLWDKSSYTL